MNTLDKFRELVENGTITDMEPLPNLLFTFRELNALYNAGLIIEGKKNVEQVGEEAFSVLIDTLNGRATKNEALGYFGSVDIFCLGPVI